MDQKKTEKLMETEMKIILDSIQSGIVIIDAETHRIIEVNPIAVKMIGAPEEKIIGAICHKYICPAGKGECPITDLGQKVDNLERVLLRANGDKVSILETVTIIVLRGRKCLLENFIDITERKKMEEKLKESEERFKSMFEQSADAILLANPKTRKIIDCNKATKKLLGYSKEEILSMYADQLHPRDLAKETMEKGFKKQLTGEIKTIESEILTKDKRRIPVSISASLIKIGGKPYMQGIFRDITEQKKMEEKLKEGEEKYRAIFEGAGDGILAADIKTKKFVFANPKIGEITGYPLKELVKLDVGKIHPKKDLPYVVDQFNKQVEGKITVAKDIPVLRKDKKIVYCDINSKVVKIGKQKYLVGFFRDITERKELEKQRLESNKRLQQLAQKLTIARDELKVAIETKGEFMNIAAHELRTPLQPIIGYADRLLQENNPTDWQKERLNIILDNAKRLLKLVQDLLDINKMETGIMKFAMAEVDLLAIIKEIYQSFKPTVEAKKLKFILDISEAPGPIKIEGDPNKLNQVFSNLLDNAIKFTDKGEITIQVKEGKNTATVSFKDTGSGITKKYMPQLFTKFFQADGTDKRKVGGTGLGLAICKEIVKAHKGKISAQSTQGKGSTFRVILPKLTRPAKRKGVENGQNFGSRR